ncbi:ribose-phosphate pyrophosphokinase [Psittacicella melopsittaci]|uniref:Ribose-phosphate pyrophosphokinase n=1 Tax=Psittacicella melopsittaci TaxID=2028576 RepID=A0A3A1Y7P4_9GAMM|nr:ribose-phosphate pyrophosphokinase [Psittacicella melopsittaci]RIY32157.1 ribose-phosphate pyrophosphokinase [Psittacicella melopsittaci]
MANIKLFAGNATRELAEKVSKRLYSKIAEATLDKFSDGEVHVQLHENVRGDEVFLIQSTCSPANDHLMEVLCMVDALRRASAGRITAVIPYFGYARQDRRVRSQRVPITARLVSDLLQVAGVDRVLTVDLHAEQIQGFFDIPVDNIYATDLLVEHLHNTSDLVNPIIVSPDIGGVVRARAMARLYNDSEIAIIDKRRPAPNVSQVMNVIGDVKDRDCILIDDIIDTGGTLVNAAKALKDRGARRVFAYASHGIFSGNAVEKIASDLLEKVVVTDSIPLRKEVEALGKVEVLSLAGTLAEAIRRINNEESVSEMFSSLS